MGRKKSKSKSSFHPYSKTSNLHNVSNSSIRHSQSLLDDSDSEKLSSTNKKIPIDISSVNSSVNLPSDLNTTIISVDVNNTHSSIAIIDSLTETEKIHNPATQNAEETHYSEEIVIDNVPIITTDSPLISNSIPITKESTRFAQTRFPFSPFIIRFISGQLTTFQVKHSLIDHCRKHNNVIEILNCRLISSLTSHGHYEFLIYAKDALSFSILLNPDNWPKTINNESFTFSKIPEIPPQLCLVLKDVDLDIDFNDFCIEIQNKFPEVKNIIRLKNKFQNEIKFVKLELTSYKIRDTLLNQKNLFINSTSYTISEYLAPASVLICTKCLGLGHFRKQCTQIYETCRTCGESANDLKNHNCTKIEKCIHCKLDHKSNSMKCQVIKRFRADLTRQILHLKHQDSQRNENFIFDPSAFPKMPTPQRPLMSINNPIVNKLDELINSLSTVKNQLTILDHKHDKFEQFIISKNQSDDIIRKEVEMIRIDHHSLNDKVIIHDKNFTQQELTITKIMLPLLDDLCSILLTQNLLNKTVPNYIEMKNKLNYHKQCLSKISEGNFSTI